MRRPGEYHPQCPRTLGQASRRRSASTGI